MPPEQAVTVLVFTGARISELLDADIDDLPASPRSDVGLTVVSPTPGPARVLSRERRVRPAKIVAGGPAAVRILPDPCRLGSVRAGVVSWLARARDLTCNGRARDYLSTWGR
jgi:hypothetical protein